jgi:deferrochelatase/peroxidase EfeB
MSNAQSGILNRPPDHLVAAAFTFIASDPVKTRSTVAALRVIVERELTSALDNTHPGSDKSTPSDETGELGFESGYDRYHLTITVGFAKAAYDKLGVQPAEEPQDLVAVPWAQLGDTPQVTDNGDLLIQVCSESIYINEHVIRRIGEELGDELTLTWIVAGAQRHTSRSGRVNTSEGRALIGFLDGTSNLDPRAVITDRRLVFVDPTDMGDYPPQVPSIAPSDPNPYAQGQPAPTFPPDLRPPPKTEPAWMAGGTYAVVRASTIDISGWDTTALGEQEQIIGRWKVSGSPLDQPDDPTTEPAAPNFAADPTGAVTRLASHIRKSNPRGPGDELRRVFRRGYPLITADGTGYRRGLVFIAFARTITTQFEFITRAWTTNAEFPVPGTGVDQLRRFESVICGGYFFVPPLDSPSQPWSWHVPPAA